MTGSLQDWIGREELRHDVLGTQPARFMQATLDRTPSLKDGNALPPLWHWLSCLDALPSRDLGRDAHPKRGGFLPPVPLPRRMWAGGRFRFHAPLRLGQGVTKQSVIRRVEEKSGRSGALCFVTVEHHIFAGETLALTEEHDIVYRADPSPGAPLPDPPKPPDDPEFGETVTPSEVMLFRYSALTFNGHRIHYDFDYARTVEGYDGLVFHGPLTATLLIDLACRQMQAMPVAFEFRGRAPIAGMTPFRIEGRQEGQMMHLWARRGDGALAMTAMARFAE